MKLGLLKEIIFKAEFFDDESEVIVTGIYGTVGDIHNIKLEEGKPDHNCPDCKHKQRGTINISTDLNI